MTKQLQICSHREFLQSYLRKKFPKARNEDIEDAVQNAIIKAVRFADKWQGNSSLRTWLTKIAVNMYTDTFRLRYNRHESVIEKHEELFLFEKISISDFSETLCQTKHLKNIVDDLFSGLEDDVCVQAFSLNVLDEINYKDIAIQHNIPIGTVKSRVFRAKKILQDKYREISHKYEETTV